MNDTHRARVSLRVGLAEPLTGPPVVNGRPGPESPSDRAAGRTRRSADDQTLAQARAAVANEPSRADLRAWLGVLLAKHGDLRDAEVELWQAIELAAHLAAPYAALSHAVARQGRIEEAVDLAYQAVDLDPEHAVLRAHLAMVLHRAGDGAGAEREMRTAVRAAQEGPWASTALGQLLATMDHGHGGPGAEAVAEYVIEQLDMSPRVDTESAQEALIAAAQRRTQLRPDDAQARAYVAILMTRVGRIDAAVDEWRRAVALAPNVASMHMSLSRAYFRQDQLEPALEAAKAGIALNPKDENDLMYLANLLVRLDRPGEACTVLREGIKNLPGSGALFLSLSRIAAKQDRLDEALVAARQATSRSPRDPLAHAHLGNLLAKSGDLDAAETALRRAVDLTPTSAGAHIRLSHLLARRDRNDEAIMSARRAVDLDPGDAAAQANLGGILARASRFAEAEVAFRRAAMAEPHNPMHQLNLGRVLTRQNRPEEARIAVAHGEALGANPAPRALGRVAAPPRRNRRQDNHA